ncbi:MAG: DUF72 domain-containing protein [Spirosomataceae bacterium]
MDFGRVESLDTISFDLPEGWHALSSNPVDDFQVKVGLPIWANPAWHGKIYSATDKEGQGLKAYAQLYQTIELNVTHYQIPSQDRWKQWDDATPDSFSFCSKFPQKISHEQALLGTQSLTQAFVDYLRGLGKKAGPSFLQLPPTFGPRLQDRLWHYLQDWPKDLAIQVEFRHPDWFNDPKTWQKTCELLQEKKVGLVCSDVPGRRDVVHASITHDTLFLRFVGHELHPTDFTRTDAWIQDKIMYWRGLGLKNAFIFIHCGDNTLAPELANYWIKNLNRLLALDLPIVPIRPQFVQGQLF